MRERRIGVMLVAVALLVAAASHPSANIRILTHDQGDRAPHRVQAAVDLGVVALSVLVTWSGRHLVAPR